RFCEIISSHYDDCCDSYYHLCLTMGSLSPSQLGTTTFNRGKYFNRRGRILATCHSYFCSPWLRPLTVQFFLFSVIWSLPRSVTRENIIFYLMLNDRDYYQYGNISLQTTYI